MLRTDLRGNPTFQELLRRVREVALGAYAHQDVPFEKLIEELQPERSLIRSPLFQVFFNMLNQHDFNLDFPGATTERISVAEVGNKFDLTLYLREEESQIRLDVVYNAELFENPAIGAMLDHYQAILEAIAARPQRPISSYRFTSSDSRNDLARPPRVIPPSERYAPFLQADLEEPISTRFELQAARFPQKLAVATTEQQWSYTTLKMKADQIASAILEFSAGAEHRVGLFFEEDTTMVAAIFGALKAGTTYVPLDPFHPPDRIAYMMGDAQVSAVLTDGHSINSARRLVNDGLRLINVDELQNADDATPGPSISPDRLAYILYTSGSTGTPKGVMQTHRNVQQHIKAYSESLQLNSDDRLTLLSSCGSDAAVMDIFGALLNGATLYATRLRYEEPAGVLERLAAEKITIYHSTPTVFRHLFNGTTPRPDFSSARCVVLGGEPAMKNDLELFKQHFPKSTVFVNGLGPTESHVGAAIFCATRH